MKLIKLTNTAGRDIFINPSSLSYICQDLMNPAITQIHLSKDVHVVKMSLEEALKFFNEKVKGS